MDKDTKVLVSIYCKIYNDTFSDEMADRLATGTEIYDFLMSDASHCFTEDGQIIPGDLNLWYLGCNEKFGFMVVEESIWTWDPGESSFDTVIAFVIELNNLGVITNQQYQILIDKIAEGRLIDNMYDIGKYLISKQDGIAWNKKQDAGKFREDIKRMVGGVEKSFKDKGFQFYK